MKYGDKRDYPKIEIFVGGEYRGTTTWAKNLREAIQHYAEANKMSPNEIRAEYREKKRQIYENQ